MCPIEKNPSLVEFANGAGLPLVQSYDLAFKAAINIFLPLRLKTCNKVLIETQRAESILLETLK